MNSTPVTSGPKGQWLLANNLQFGRDPLGFLERSARDFGDTVRLRLGSKTTYLISDPTVIEHILVNRTDYPKSDLLRGPLMLRVAGDGIFLSEGDFWLRQRRLMQPAFHRDRINAYARVMSQYSAEMCERWSIGSTIDLQKEMMRLTLAIANKTLFDVEIRDSHYEEVGEAFESLSNHIAPTANMLRLLLGAILPIGRKQFERAAQRLDRVINELISKHDSWRLNSDLLSTLKDARDEQGLRMTPSQLRDEVITLFLAGHETSAIALTWTIYLIAQHRNVESRIRRELDQALSSRLMTLEDVPRLKYLEKVIREAMRLYPPVWMMARMSRKDQQAGSWRVTKGAQIFLSQWVVQRDPRFYPHAAEFNPDRWTDDFTRNLPKYAYFPFGGGPRVCIGQSFAMLEITIALATIFQKTRLTPKTNDEIQPSPSLTLRPGGPIYMLVGEPAKIPA